MCDVAMPSFSLTETCIGEGSSGKIIVAVENSTGFISSAHFEVKD